VVRLAVVGKTNLATAPTSPWNLTADVLTFVPDSAKPIFTSFPSDIVAEATSPAGTAVTFSATAVDNKDGTVPVDFTPESGDIYPFGETLVVGTAQDFSGNIAVSSFIVSVVDTTAPEIQSLTASPASLRKPNHKMVEVIINAVATDAVDPNPHTQIIAVASNEPETGPGHGNTAPDWEITGDLTLRLRNERSEQGSGRLYTITVESRDSAKNASTATVTVSVPNLPED
jgi:hypothetical protein